jgi:hypothetical protein
MYTFIIFIGDKISLIPVAKITVDIPIPKPSEFDIYIMIDYYKLFIHE